MGVFIFLVGGFYPVFQYKELGKVARGAFFCIQSDKYILREFISLIRLCFLSDQEC